MQTNRLVSALALSLLLGSASAATIKIASVSPLSGEKGVLGVEIKRGAELAVNRQARAFERLGYTLELVSYDDEATPGKAAGIAQKLIADRDVLGVIGAQNSGVSKALAEALAPSGMAMISPTSTNDGLTANGWAHFSRVVAPDRAQTLAAANYVVKTLKAESVYVASDNTTYGNGLSEAFQQALSGSDVKIAGYIGASSAQQLATLVRNVKASGATLVYYGGTDVAAAEALVALRKAGVTTRFMSGDGIYSDKFTKDAGAYAAGVVFSSTFTPPNYLNAAKDMLHAYRVRYKTTPNGRAAFSFDATNVLLTAILAELQKAKAAPSRAAVTKAVRNINLTPCKQGALVCPNVTGQISFNASGNRVKSVVYMMQYSAALRPEMISLEEVDAATLR